MALKKAEFSEDEIPIYEDALVYKRGEYWPLPSYQELLFLR